MKKNKILRAAIYIRVSTSEQAMRGYSLPAQKAFLTEYAEQHNMLVVATYVDEGKSARKNLKKRKQIHVLLSDVKEGKIDVVLFLKMDRWFRNVSDFYKVQEVLDKYHVKWIAAAEESCNMETREGQLNVNIHLTFGQNESDSTSERTRLVRSSMVRNGRAICGSHSLPFGFIVSNVSGRKIVVHDPENEHIALDAMRYYILNKNKGKTARYIQTRYGIHFTIKMLTTLLSSELIIGKFRDNSDYCEPYISMDDFKIIQSSIHHDVKSASPNKIYLFTGLIKCPVCGRSLGGSSYHRPAGKRVPERNYTYYRCPKSYQGLCTYRLQVNESVIEKYLLDNMEPYMREFHLESIRVREAKKIAMKGRSESVIRDEMNRLNLIFQKGRISFDFYDQEYSKLEKELLQIDLIEEDEPDLDSMLRYIADFKEMYDSLDREQKKVAWHNLLKEVTLSDDYHVNGISFL